MLNEINLNCDENMFCVLIYSKFKIGIKSSLLLPLAANLVLNMLKNAVLFQIHKTMSLKQIRFMFS